MLLKYLDEAASMIGGGMEEEERQVTLLELTGIEDGGSNPVAVWAERADVDVPSTLLFYDDTDDGSNAMLGSWQQFYLKGASLADKERAPVLGGSGMMKGGRPKWSGMAKAAAYLRYSGGFLSWLETVDPRVAEVLRREREQFPRLFVNPERGKMHTKWRREPKVPREAWVLPVVCVLSGGRMLVLGFSPLGYEEIDEDVRADLEEEGIALRESLELAGFFRLPPRSSRQIVAGELHAGSGMGRNAFGFTDRPANLTVSEYTRLLGPLLQHEGSQVLRAWNERLRYRVRLAPNPEASEMIFHPEQGMAYETLAQIIRYEEDKQKQYRAARRQASRKRSRDLFADADASPPILAEAPNYIPHVHRATVLLINMEGSQKKKVNVLGVFPSVYVAYWEFLNTEFLETRLEAALVGFFRAAVTGRERASGREHAPSIYNVWTHMFTAALQRRFISARPLWNSFQRYCKAFSSDELIGAASGRRAAAYLDILGKLRRLQHIIGVWRDGLPDIDELTPQLPLVEQARLVQYGVMEAMNRNMPGSAREYLGDELYDLLRPAQQRKIDEFVRQAWQGAPEPTFPAFVRGALVGMLLRELAWVLEQEGRRFEPTQGRHPATLRGPILPAVFAKGVGLLMNVQAEHKFNCRLLPFIEGCAAESRTDAFNNGLIMGLAYIPPKGDGGRARPAPEESSTADVPDSEGN